MHNINVLKCLLEVFNYLCTGRRQTGWHLVEHGPAVCPSGQEGQWHLGLYQK